MNKVTVRRIIDRLPLCFAIILITVILIVGIYVLEGNLAPSEVNYNGIEISCDDNDYKTDADEIRTLALNNKDVTIQSSGTYRLSGTLENASINVASADDGVVHLILDNVNVTCSEGPALYIYSADKVVVTTADNSVNSFTSTVSDGLESAVYSTSDITFNGNGNLSISSENGIGVNCNATVKFISGNYDISSKENCIKASYGASVKGGVLNISSQADAISTTASGKSSGKWIGTVEIAGGDVNITSERDGISSGSVVHISAGNLNISSGGGSTEMTQDNSFGFMMNKMPGFSQESDEDTESTKGIKADTGIYITGGTVNLDCLDDGIHSDNNVTVDNGTITIKTNGDGIQGDKRATVNGGEIHIQQASEGICGRYVTINDGNINVIASDDGINATNNDNPIASLSTESEILGTGGKIIINGGNIEIVAACDGLDSNGSIIQTGGIVSVTSKSNGVEVPVDYTGTYKMTGGDLIAFGSGGMMAQTITADESTAYSVSINGSVTEGNEIEIVDENGSTLVTALCNYGCSSVMYASDKLTDGMTVTLYADGSEAGTGTASDASSGGNGFGNMFGNMQNGEMPSDFGNGEMPSDFGNGEMPSDFGNGEMPSNFGNGEMPSDFGNGEMPSDFGNGEMPSDFGNGEMPSDFGNGEMPSNFGNGEMPDNMQGGQMGGRPGGNKGQFQQGQQQSQQENTSDNAQDEESTTLADRQNKGNRGGMMLMGAGLTLIPAIVILLIVIGMIVITVIAFRNRKKYGKEGFDEDDLQE